MGPFWPRPSLPQALHASCPAPLPTEMTQAGGMPGWSLIRLRGKRGLVKPQGRRATTLTPQRMLIMGRAAGPRLRPAPANLITGSLAAACLHLPDTTVLIPSGSSLDRQFKLNQALVPGTEWAIHWPCHPLAKQTPQPYGGTGKLAGRVASGQPCSGLHRPTQKKGRLQGPWCQARAEGQMPG